MKQGGTELCQAQVKLEVTVTIVVEARRSLSYFIGLGDESMRVKARDARYAH